MSEDMRNQLRIIGIFIVIAKALHNEKNLSHHISCLANVSEEDVKKIFEAAKHEYENRNS